MSRLVIGDALRRGDLVELAVPFLDLRRPLMVVLRRDAYIGAGLRALLDFLVERYADAPWDAALAPTTKKPA